MIERIMPITRNKMGILKEVYAAGETHMLEISKRLGLHPYSVQKTLASLKYVMEMKPSGKTKILKICRENGELAELLYLIEDYMVGAAGKKTKTVIGNIQAFFSKNKNILTCCLFGSYAREAFTEKSDVDLFFVIKKDEDEILKACRDISSVLGKEINPVIMREKEFFVALETKEPAIETILKPSQRLLLIGKEYFLRNTIL